YAAEMRTAGNAAADPAGHARLAGLVEKWRPGNGFAPAAKRGWEWHLLSSLAQEVQILTIPCPGAVKSLDWSPDGKTIHSAGYAAADSWDSSTGKKLQRHSSGREARWLLASPDGLHLALVSDGRLSILPRQGGPALKEWPEAPGSVTRIAWHPAGAILAVGHAGSAGKLMLWHWQMEREPDQIAVPGGWGGFVWSPSGDRLVLVRGNQPPLVIFPGEAERRMTMETPPDADITCAAWSPDGKHIAGGTRAGEVLLWDAASGKSVHKLNSPGFPVLCLEWSRQGALAAGDEGGLMSVWKEPAAPGEAPLVHKGHRLGIHQVKWSQDGTRLASCSEDKSVRIWPGDGSGAFQMTKTLEFLSARPQWSPDGSLLALPDRETLTLAAPDASGGWKARTKLPFKIGAVSWSPDGSRLAAVNEAPGVVMLLDAAELRETRRIQSPTPGVSTAEWSPDGTMLATAGRWPKSSGLRIWSAQTGELLWEPAKAGEGAHLFQKLAWHPEGRILAAQPGIGPVSFFEFDPETRTLKRFAENRDAGVWASPALRWKPDGSALLTAGLERTLDLRDPSGSGMMLSLRGHTARVQGFDWSPDGSRIVSIGQDRILRWWDALSGDELLSLPLPGPLPGHVSWSPDGSRILVTDQDGQARMLDALPGMISHPAADCLPALVARGEEAELKLFSFEDFDPEIAWRILKVLETAPTQSQWTAASQHSRAMRFVTTLAREAPDAAAALLKPHMDSALLQLGLARSEALRGEWAAAAAHYQRAMPEAGRFPEMLYEAAIAARLAGDEALFDASFEKLLAHSSNQPNNEQIACTLARTAAVAGAEERLDKDFARNLAARLLAGAPRWFKSTGALLSHRLGLPESILLLAAHPTPNPATRIEPLKRALATPASAEEHLQEAEAWAASLPLDPRGGIASSRVHPTDWLEFAALWKELRTGRENPDLLPQRALLPLLATVETNHREEAARVLHAALSGGHDLSALAPESPVTGKAGILAWQQRFSPEGSTSDPGAAAARWHELRADAAEKRGNWRGSAASWAAAAKAAGTAGRHVRARNAFLISKQWSEAADHHLAALAFEPEDAQLLNEAPAIIRLGQGAPAHREWMARHGARLEAEGDPRSSAMRLMREALSPGTPPADTFARVRGHTQAGNPSPRELPFRLMTLALASLRAGDPAAAVSFLDQDFALFADSDTVPMLHGSIRALILSHLGETAAANQTLKKVSADLDSGFGRMAARGRPGTRDWHHYIIAECLRLEAEEVLRR
ncbi:MAG TPA: WD40 repeat domain-containing protein, partial [Prosthecobacter sp.]|nr:WD40 repeat domain-containing protein [Prosthecobacter sp.]